MEKEKNQLSPSDNAITIVKKNLSREKSDNSFKNRQNSQDEDQLNSQLETNHSHAESAIEANNGNGNSNTNNNNNSNLNLNPPSDMFSPNGNGNHGNPQSTTTNTIKSNKSSYRSKVGKTLTRVFSRTKSENERSQNNMNLAGLSHENKEFLNYEHSENLNHQKEEASPTSKQPHSPTRPVAGIFNFKLKDKDRDKEHKEHKEHKDHKESHTTQPRERRRTQDDNYEQRSPDHHKNKENILSSSSFSHSHNYHKENLDKSNSLDYNKSSNRNNFNKVPESSLMSISERRYSMGQGSKNKSTQNSTQSNNNNMNNTNTNNNTHNNNNPNTTITRLDIGLSNNYSPPPLPMKKTISADSTNNSYESHVINHINNNTNKPITSNQGNIVTNASKLNKNKHAIESLSKIEILLKNNDNETHLV